MALHHERSVSFSQRAVDDLDDIHAFLTRIFSKQIASASIENTLDRIVALEGAPFASRKDHTVRDLGVDVRYVIVKKVRIQFEITDKEIVILRILDARQFPSSF